MKLLAFLLYAAVLASTLPTPPSLRIKGPDAPNATAKSNPLGAPASNLPSGKAPIRFPSDGRLAKAPCKGKRMQCTPDSSMWDELDIENKYRQPGRAQMYLLDNIKSNPPTQTPDTRELKENYVIEWGCATQESEVPHSTRILEELYPGLISDEEELWTRLKVKNKEENVEVLLAKQKIEENMSADEIEARRRENGGVEGILTTYQRPNYKGIIIHNSRNKNMDVLRANQEEGPFKRTGVDDTKSSQWTDQVMYGWRKECEAAGVDPKDAGLDYIFRSAIETKATNDVIKASMERAGHKITDKADDLVVFRKGDPDPTLAEGFEAISGTVHGIRVTQMLKDHHSVMGDRTVTAYSIKRADYSDEDDGKHDSMTWLLRSGGID